MKGPAWKAYESVMITLGWLHVAQYVRDHFGDTGYAVLVAVAVVFILGVVAYFIREAGEP